jgi:hypothetical protein
MDINTILEKWDNAKKDKLYFEKQCLKYKEAVERYMNKKDINTVDSKIYTVTKRSNTRHQLSKQNVPENVWIKYSTRFTYNSYHLKKK